MLVRMACCVEPAPAAPVAELGRVTMNVSDEAAACAKAGLTVRETPGFAAVIVELDPLFSPEVNLSVPTTCPLKLVVV